MDGSGATTVLSNEKRGEVDKRLLFTAAIFKAVCIGFGTYIASAITTATCYAWGGYDTWYGKAACIGIPVLLSSLGTLAGGYTGYNAYKAGNSLSNLQNAASTGLTVLNTVKRDNNENLLTDFVKVFTDEYSKVTGISGLADVAIQNATLLGTSIAVTHGLLALSHLKPIILDLGKNITQMHWRSNQNDTNTMHVFTPFGDGKQVYKRAVCESGRNPVYGPGEGSNGGESACTSGATHGGVYYGLQFYGSSYEWGEVEEAIGDRNFYGAENFANALANDMTYWNHRSSCVCHKISDKWVSTGSIEVAAYGEPYDGYGNCWAANCGQG